MSIKTILVHIDHTDNSETRLAATIALAIEYDAHIIGQYVIPTVNIAPAVTSYIPSAVILAQEESAKENASKIKAEFIASAEKSGCSFEWNCVQGFTDQQINKQGHYADLIVIGQSDGQVILSNEMAIEDHILMDSIRPILFIPYIGFSGPIGKRIMIAYDGGRESVRAIHDSIPMLKRADAVEIISVNRSEKASQLPLDEICQYLARHGIKTQANHVVSKDINVAETLLSRASDYGIDLIVMGAYGHSRLREYIFGGVTHDILKHMTVPVLMSH